MQFVNIFKETITISTDYEGFLDQLFCMEVDTEEEHVKERKIKGAKFSYRYPFWITR